MVSVPEFDVEALNVLGKIIGKLERFHLEGSTPEEYNPADLIPDAEQAFFRVKGLSSFWKSNTGTDFGQHIVDLVISAHNQYHADLTVILLGEPARLSLFVSLGTRATTQMILEGLFPGILLELVDTRQLIRRLHAHCLAKGVVTGVPSSKALLDNASSSDPPQDKNGQRSVEKSPQSGQRRPQLERVIRGMHGATWVYIVQAHPRPRNKVIEERMKTIDIMSQVTTHSRTQWSSTKNTGSQLTTIESSGLTQSYSGELVNYRAQYLIRLLEREIERLDQASAAGQWTVGTYFGASSRDEAERLASLLLGTLAGTDSRPEPLRATLCQRTGQSLDYFQSFLTSHEVAALIQLPREEVPGYAIRDHVTFGVDFENPDPTTLPLGTIQQNNRDTQDAFAITLTSLAKHVVVIGVTGSGKTTTVMNLLDRVAQANKPFLVIEPAKTEYRSLHSALPPGQELRVYTLGNEMVAPFRLNPFEFELGDEPGDASLLTHIDFLKAVFNAAFVLYSPMPQVLEEALHEVYEDKGWDLTSGTNRRLSNWSERHKHPIFPTLTNLYYKVEEVTKRLGYDKEIESNIQAGLKARVGSLRIGSKGLMLDTPRSIPMQTLLSVPTILELEGIGNDDEKTFVMGLFLARLYEYRRLLAATNAAAKGLSSFDLQHLMVFEEAHRLLQNTSTQVGVESANPRAQAIEVFTNMLSEMRAYGQGVLVAEQIPSKLAPDVLKNTNLKIVHRLIAQDDRQSIGQTMNLNEDQQMYLGVLNPGMAAVYAEGADHAYLVRMENYKRKLSALIDADLRRMSRRYASVRPFLSVSDFEAYDIPGTIFGGPDPAIYHAAGKLLDAPKSKWLWSSILLCLSSDPSNLHKVLLRFSEHIEEMMPHLSREQHDVVARMVLICGGAEMMHRHGARLGWTYGQVEQLRSLLTHGLVRMLQAFQNIPEESDEAVAERFTATIAQGSESLAQFVDAYGELTQRRQGPFVGCTHCQFKCLYRQEVRSLLTEPDCELIEEKLRDQYESDEERYAEVAHAATYIAEKWLGENLTSMFSRSIASIGYCATLHAMVNQNINEYDQASVSNQLKTYLLDAKEE